MSNFVKTTLRDGVLSLQLDRIEKKNALTNEMYGALADGLTRAASEPQIRCVMISGAGGVFTAGNDVGDFARFASGAVDISRMEVSRFLHELAKLDCPVVAAVDGLAVGIGMTMLLHCDLVYLSETAVLSAPFVDLALVPEAGSSLLLPARIGHVRAFSVFVLGEKISANDAVSMGLANAVVPADALIAYAEVTARSLAAKLPDALRASKRLLRDRAAIIAQMAVEGDIFKARLASPEAQEIFAAFAERRPPELQRFLEPGTTP